MTPETIYTVTFFTVWFALSCIILVYFRRKKNRRMKRNEVTDILRAFGRECIDIGSLYQLGGMSKEDCETELSISAKRVSDTLVQIKDIDINARSSTTHEVARRTKDQQVLLDTIRIARAKGLCIVKGTDFVFRDNWSLAQFGLLMHQQLSIKENKHE